ncbi:MAG: Ig-like domain-containing protein [Fervidobacterium sp.]
MKKYVFTVVAVLLVLLAMFSCTPTPVNKPPVWTAESYTVSSTVGQEVVFDLSDKVSDPDGDPVTITVESTSATVTSEKKFKFTTTEAGSFVFKLKASDGKGGTAVAFLVVQVSPVPNNKPTWKNGPYTASVEKGQVLQYDLSGKVEDPDGDSVTVTIEVQDFGATIEGTVFKWNTAGVNEGVYNFTLKATDSKGLFAYESLTVTVNPPVVPNRAPVVLPLANVSAKVGQEISIDLKNYVSDPDGDPIQITKISGPGAIVGTKYVWFPSKIVDSYETVTLKFSDGRGGETTSSFKVIAQTPGSASVVVYVTDYKSGPATQGATVSILRNGDVVAFATTDENGKASFSDLLLTSTDFDVLITKDGYAKTYIEGLRLKDGQTLEFETQMRVATIGNTASNKPFEIDFEILDQNGNPLNDNTVYTDKIMVTGMATSTEYTFNLWYVKVGGVPGTGTFTNPRVIGYSGEIYAAPSVAEFEGMTPVYIDMYDQNDNRYEKIVYIYVSRTPATAITPYIVQKYTNAVPTGYNIVSVARRAPIEYYGKKDPKPTAAENGTNLYVRIYWRPWYSTSGTTKPKAYKIYRSFDGVLFEPVAIVPNTVYTFTDYSAKLEPNKKVWYAVSSVYDGYEAPYTIIGNVIPLPMFSVTDVSPINGSVDVPRDPEFTWRFNGPTTTSEGNVTYLYDIWLYDEVVNDYGYYSISKALNGSYSIFGLIPASDGGTVNIKFSDYTNPTSPYRWVDFAALNWYPYDKLQANKTYEWGNELLAARVIDSTDRSISYAIYIDNNNVLGFGTTETEVYHRFVTGDN